MYCPEYKYLEYNQYIKNLGRKNIGIANLDKIDIINRDYYEALRIKHKFVFHEWYQYAKFTTEETELLNKYT